MNHRFQLTCVLTIAFSLTLLLMSGSSVLAHSGVFLADADGRVAVGGAHGLFTAEERYDLTTHVFEGIMVSSFPPFNPKDYGGDHPCFFALSSGITGMPVGATALPGTADVSLDFTSLTVNGNADTLYYWDGSGAVDFQPVSTTQPDVSLTVDPEPMDTTSESGGLHVHPAYGLDDGGTGVPADGVYLTSPTVSVDGLTDSEPFYMLWLVDSLILDEDAAEEVEESLEAGQTFVLGEDFGFFEQAVEYVQQNLAVPEPSSALLSLLAAAGTFGFFFRRQQG
jgi:hypothetical protein